MRKLAMKQTAFWCCCVASHVMGLELKVADQIQLDLTVYKDFVVVHDVRESVLPVGHINLEFEGIAQTIDPGSVRVSSSAGENMFEILEQAYAYDFLNKQSLLERFIGRKIKYSRSILQETSYEKILREGILLSIDPEIVKFGDEIEIAPEGVISLPYVPETLKTIPTLSWQVNNKAVGPQAVATSYIAGGMSWLADYRITLNEAETSMDISAWVNVTNETGIDYSDAAIRVVAGDVRRLAVTPVMNQRNKFQADAMMMESAGPAQALSDYYVYDLERRVNLASHQTRQIKFMSAAGIAIEKKYIAESQIVTHRVPQSITGRFNIERSFVNAFGDGAGMPLPAGRASVFTSRGEGTLDLLGEGWIADSPRGETVRLVTGQAFDLVIERTQTDLQRVSEHSNRLTYEVVLRNRKTDAVTVLVHEKLFGDWVIISQTADGRKIDSTTQEFAVDLDAGETRSFTYTAEITL